MCFSEQASFSAAAVLSLMSIVSIRIVKGIPRLYPIALIPLFFGIQQASEGVQWLYYKEIWGTAQGVDFAKNIFMFFAFCFWPAWLPICLYLPEKKNPNKQILFGLSIVGILLGLYNGWRIYFIGPTVSMITGNSIYYETPVSYHEIWPYLILVILPWFTSSHKKTSLMGIIYGLSAVTAWLFYTNTFTSVWCFFAGIISVFIIITLRELKKSY